MGRYINLVPSERGEKGDKGDRGTDGAGSVPPSNTSIVYSMGKVVSVSNASGTTTLNRDSYGNLISVTFPSHTKTFTIIDGTIVGYIVS